MPVPERLLDLLPPLLDGGFEAAPWRSFLDALRDATRSDYASLSFRPPGKTEHSVLHLYSGTAWPSSLGDYYREHFHQLDPMPYFRLAEGQSYAVQDLLRPGEPLHDTYYRDFLVPSGMSALRIMRVTEASGVNAWLSIARGRDFDPETGALMDGLAPYLRSALRAYVALEHERFNVFVADEAISRLDFGWFTLDAVGHILETDSQGERLFNRSGALGRGADGRLTARPRALEIEIMNAVQTLVADPRSRRRAIILGRDPWTDMLLAPAQKSLISAKPDPAVIAYVHRDSWSSADRCEQLAELFKLTPSESRLALALSRGLNITDAAADLGLTVETTRNYTKRIYAKLGVRGQVDLVRLIMRSVLVIA